MQLKSLLLTITILISSINLIPRDPDLIKSIQNSIHKQILEPEDNFSYYYEQAKKDMTTDPEMVPLRIEEGVKHNALLTDGRTFLDFEHQLRLKYSHINIPNIILSDNPVIIGYTNKASRELPNVVKYEAKDTIVISPDYLTYTDPKLLELIILHEAGHHDSHKIHYTESWNNYSWLGFAYVWGIHKTKPYRNIATKLASKTIAGILVTTMCHLAFMRFYEEPYADTFACKHASEETLKHATLENIQPNFDKQHKHHLELLLNHTLKEIGNDTIKFQLKDNPDIVLHDWLKVLLSLDHPSTESRVAKFQYYLAKRFPKEH